MKPQLREHSFFNWITYNGWNGLDGHHLIKKRVKEPWEANLRENYQQFGEFVRAINHFYAENPKSQIEGI